MSSFPSSLKSIPNSHEQYRSKSFHDMTNMLYGEYSLPSITLSKASRYWLEDSSMVCLKR